MLIGAAVDQVLLIKLPVANGMASGKCKNTMPVATRAPPYRELIISTLLALLKI